MVGENNACSLCVQTWLSFGCKKRGYISEGYQLWRGSPRHQPGFTIVFIAYLLKRDILADANLSKISEITLIRRGKFWSKNRVAQDK